MQISVEVNDKNKGLLTIMSIFSELQINIRQIEILTTQKHRHKIDLSIEFINPTKIDFLLNNLKNHRDLLKIVRKKFL